MLAFHSPQLLKAFMVEFDIKTTPERQVHASIGSALLFFHTLRGGVQGVCINILFVESNCLGIGVFFLI